MATSCSRGVSGDLAGDLTRSVLRNEHACSVTEPVAVLLVKNIRGDGLDDPPRGAGMFGRTATVAVGREEAGERRVALPRERKHPARLDDAGHSDKRITRFIMPVEFG